MHEVVQPVVPVPYFMEDNVRFTHVAVDVVQGKDMLFHIIYLATGRFLTLCVCMCLTSVSLFIFPYIIYLYILNILLSLFSPLACFWMLACAAVILCLPEDFETIVSKSASWYE